MSQASLTILIPTYGRPTLLGRTLESLSNCDIPEGYVETVVIENGPKSGAEAVVRDTAIKYPHLKIRYMHVERANKSHALNEALATMRDELIIFFDDDVRFDPGVIIAYNAAAKNNPRNCFFGGPVSVDQEAPPPSWLSSMLPRSARGMEFDSEQQGNDYLGFNWAAYVHDLKEVGLFDSNFGPGSPTKATGQEAEMQRRLISRGLTPIDVHDARVWHYVPTSRSTPQWGAQRRFQRGISDSIKVDKGELLRRARLAASSGIKSLIVMVLTRKTKDPERYWRARFGLAYNLGLLKGLTTRINKRHYS